MYLPIIENLEIHVDSQRFPPNELARGFRTLDKTRTAHREQTHERKQCNEQKQTREFSYNELLTVKMKLTSSQQC